MSELNLKNKKSILSIEALSFIESIIEKYELEKEIENEEEVKKRLEKVDDFLTRAGIKFIFSKKIGELIEKKSLKELPSFKLKELIKELGEGRVSDEEISNVIEKRLKVSQKISKQIAKDFEEIKPIAFIKESDGKDVYEKPIIEKYISEKTVSAQKSPKIFTEPSEKIKASVNFKPESSKKPERKESKQKSISEKKEPAPKEQDSYRESI